MLLKFFLYTVLNFFFQNVFLHKNKYLKNFLYFFFKRFFNSGNNQYFYKNNFFVGTAPSLTYAELSYIRYFSDKNYLSCLIVSLKTQFNFVLCLNKDFFLINLTKYFVYYFFTKIIYTSINNINFYNNKHVAATDTLIFKKNNVISFNCFNKNIDILNFNHLIFYFLRKNKSFNKGRYSRNRQNYRTGFYWCIYVNVVALLGLNFLFYKFCINFSALWLLFFCFACSPVVPYILKYGFLFYINIYHEFFLFFVFLKNFFNSFKLFF